MLQQEPDTLLGSPPKHTCAHTPTPPPPHTVGVIIQVWQCTAVIPACSKENKTPGPTLLLTCCQYHPQTTVAQDEASRKIRESIPPLTCNLPLACRASSGRVDPGAGTWQGSESERSRSPPLHRCSFTRGAAATGAGAHGNAPCPREDHFLPWIHSAAGG